MREIILDLETTGLDPKKGHKIVEIGCIEIINKTKTDNIFHVYLDPERDMPDSAFYIHGISSKFLEGKPKFREVAKDFIAFIGDSKIVAHNASFDVGFLNHELGLLDYKGINENNVIDTLFLARRSFPGASVSLDSLCKRYGISLEDRKKKGHGALLDSELLYEVYIRLINGIQSEFGLSKITSNKNEEHVMQNKAKSVIPARKFSYQQDTNEHKEFIKTIKNNAWSKKEIIS